MEERVRTASSASTRRSPPVLAADAARPDPGASGHWPDAPGLLQGAVAEGFRAGRPAPALALVAPASVGDALVSFRSRRGTLTFTVNEGDPEDVSFFNRDKRLQILLYASGGRESDYDEDERRAADILSHDLNVRFDPPAVVRPREDTLSLNLLEPSTNLRLQARRRSPRPLRHVPGRGEATSSSACGARTAWWSRSGLLRPVGEARLVVRYVGDPRTPRRSKTRPCRRRRSGVRGSATRRSSSRRWPSTPTETRGTRGT